MNRDQKATAIAEIATRVRESDAVFVVDYRGLSVPQAADLRERLREQDATLAVTKNTLVRRALDQDGVDAEALRPHLDGPNALTFVRGDVAAAAKVLADFGRTTRIPELKGGLVEGEGVDAAQLQAIARLPSRQVLYGQLVGVVASPLTGLARGLGGLVSGLAVALGGVLEQKASGAAPAGEGSADDAPGGDDASAAEAATADDPEPARNDAPDGAETTDTDGGATA